MFSKTNLHIWTQSGPPQPHPILAILLYTCLTAIAFRMVEKLGLPILG